MKYTLILVLAAAVLVTGLDLAATAQVIPFKVVRTFVHTNNYSSGLAWENDTIWVGYAFSATLENYDPYTGTMIKTMKSPSSSVRGLAFDGMDLWVATWSSSPPSSIYMMDTVLGTVITTKIAPFTTGPSDGLAWDGATLWAADEANHIYQIDTLRWQVINSLNVPSSGSSNPRGLAWDNRSNTIWAGYQSSSLIRKHNPQNGSVIEEFTSPYTWSQQGLAWDGWFLWATGGQQSGMLDVSQIDVTMPFMVMKGQLKGGTPIQFELTRADNQSGNMFAVGWSGSGTHGFNVGGKLIPLTFDNFTIVGLQLLPFFSMVIDTSGSATTSPFMWPALPAGIPFWVCGVTLDQTGVVSVNEPIKYVTQ